MTPEQTSRQEMIDYLNTLKFAHQSHALNEISRHGSEQYAQHEMDKAQMVEEIVEIVEAKFIGDEMMQEMFGIPPGVLDDVWKFDKDDRQPICGNALQPVGIFGTARWVGPASYELHEVEIKEQDGYINPPVDKENS